LAYILFILGFISKILNIINGDVFNFEYSDLNSKLFFIEYLSSMNVLNLLSLLLFIAYFYIKKSKINNMIFLLPLIYFIFFISFAPGGRVNFIIISLYIFYFEILNSQSVKKLFFKFLIFLCVFIILFNFLTIKKDSTLLSYLGIQVVVNDKEMYFYDLNYKNKKLIDVFLNNNLEMFICKKNIEEYENKEKYSKYDVCKTHNYHNYDLNIDKVTTVLKIENTDKSKEVTFNNNIKTNIILNSIYNITVRLNNYRPLSSLLYLIEKKEINERSIIKEYKKIFLGFVNSFTKYINITYEIERNSEVDNFYIKSGIGNATYELGVSPTLIGDIYWIGGFKFLFFNAIIISIIIHILNYLFISNNYLLKSFSFYFFLQFASSFEQSFEAYNIIFLKNLLIIILCLFINAVINKLNNVKII